MGFFLLTGMFRSGSTYLSRLLDNQKNIYCNSDVFFHPFKLLRYTVLKKENIKVDFESPLEDYFLSFEDQIKFKKIIECKLDTSFKRRDVNLTQKLMLERANLYEKNLIPLLKKFKPKKFSDYIKMTGDYSKKNFNKKIFGYKSNWCNEFSYPLIKKFPKIKIIFIVRDPRSVINSKLGRKIKYPLMPMIYQWRKSVGIMLDIFRNHNDHNNVYICKYENLVSKPKKTIKSIMRFLGDKNKNIVLTKDLLDANKKKWHQNSSFKNNEIKKLNNWKTKLNKNQIKVIENLCFYEMRLLNYKCQKNNSFFNEYKKFNKLEKKPYDMKFVRYLKKNYNFNKNLFSLEKSRNYLLSSKKMNIKTNNKDIEKFFLKKEIYRILKNAKIR